MFEWMQSTWLAHWMDVSKWAFPFILTVHDLGMTVVVGVTIMTAVRVLGFPGQVPLGAYAAALPWMLWSFLFNFLTGAVLFIHDAVALSTNPSFLIKIVSLLIGAVVQWQLYVRVILPAHRADQTARDAQMDGAPVMAAGGGGIVALSVPGWAKALAIANIVLWWLSVVVSGRLIAFLAAPP